MNNGYGYAGGFNTNGNGNGNDNGSGSGIGMGHGDSHQSSTMMIMDQENLLGGSGQSLDDIVNQNAKMIRRQSMPQPYNNNAQHPDMRRISLMEYDSRLPGAHANNYQFDTDASMVQGYASGGIAPSTSNNNQQQPSLGRHGSVADLSLDTGYGNSPHAYGSMMHPGSAYSQSPAHATNTMDMTMGSPYIDSNMGMNLDYGVDPGLSNSLSDDAMISSVYSQQNYSQPQSLTPMHAPPVPPQGTPHSGKTMTPDHGSSSVHHQYGGSTGNGTPGTVRHHSRPQSLHVPDLSPAHGASPLSQPPMSIHTQMMPPPSPSPRNPQPQSQLSPPRQALQQQQQVESQQVLAVQQQHGIAPVTFPSKPQRSNSGNSDSGPVQIHSSGFDRGLAEHVPSSGAPYNPNNQGFAWEAPEGGWPTTMTGKPHMASVYKNAYSSTGFDMLGVLMRIATRPDPQINIGSVDLSCAFVVCDAEKDDMPIVYCSDNFERLTGYTKHMILGRNCRFLQSPDGNVVSGIRRKYVDDDSVVYLKNMITSRREAQISLINYRRGGQPFMNLLTIIPITWDGDHVKFYVGFQVDLVEQPNAVTNKNPDGSYSINYQRGMTMPRYVMNAPESATKNDYGQTIPRDDVSAILSTIGSGESEYAKRMWDKVLLENTDDVVHVLSLKGLFQWVSPSALRVLEYEPGEIVGTALSSICHPSDIVPVTRELKDTSTGASVNVVFRIRRKNSGYMWFEGHGSLHTEQGKGRKSIIMVGRERPVYTLSKNEIIAAGGIGENELWTKMSTSGMFLFVSSNVRQLLDRQPDDLVGISIQSLMRIESRSEFGRILEHARTGKKASVKHEMINRRGQVLSAFTTLYPGDATEGQKPTFIVAQTRLVKFSRGNHAQSRPGIYPKGDRNSSESIQSNNTGLAPQRDGEQTPSSAGANAQYLNTDGAAATYAGQNGLLLGKQDQSLASEDNLFDELKTTKSSSWQYEIRQLEKRNRILAEEVQSLTAAKKKRKRRKGAGNAQKDCANCHTRVTPEWRRGPSGQRDLCNSCGLRWAKLNGKVSPRTSSQHSMASDKASKASASPRHQPGPPANHNQTSGDTSRAQAQTGNISQKPSTVDGHGASMEGAVGVPARIDEGVEPE